MYRLITFVLFLLFAAETGAQEPVPVSALDAAWAEYVELRDSPSKSKKTVADRVAAAKRVVDIASKELPRTDERLPLLMKRYGEELLDARKPQAAQKVLKEAVVLTEEIHGKGSVELIPVLSSYADSTAERRDSVSQLKNYKRALGIASKAFGDNSTEYADLAMRAGSKILDLSRTTDGRKYLREAREIYLADQGEDAPSTGLATFYLGKLEMSRGNYQTATHLLLDALKGFQGGEETDAAYRLVTRSLLVRAYEVQGKSDLATEHCVAIGADSMITPDQDYVPIFRMAPSYPKDMLRKGAEGYVDLAFTVDATGFVTNPEVIGGSGNASFEEEALVTVGRFRYAARHLDGEPVAVENVKTRISFRIKD